MVFSNDGGDLYWRFTNGDSVKLTTGPAEQLRVEPKKTIKTTRIERLMENGCVVAMDIERHYADGAFAGSDERYWVDGHLVAQSTFHDALQLLNGAGVRVTRVENGALK